MPIRDEYKEWYGPDWKALADQLKAAAGYCCQRCGAKHGTAIIQPDPLHPEKWELIETESQATGALSDGIRIIEVQIGVAHLNHKPWDRSPSNLKVLCRGCHLKHDAKHHAMTKKINERKAAISSGQQELEL